MIGTSGRRHLRALGAACSVLVLAAGMVLVATIAGGASRALANLTGASPPVFVTAAGAVDELPLSSIQSGTTVSGSTSNTEFGPIAINATATKVLVAETPLATTTFVPPGLEVINVAGGGPSAPTPLPASPISLAMDPINPNIAFVLENDDGSASIERVNIGVSPPAVTPFVAGPMNVNGGSIAISPDGATLYVGGGIGDTVGVEAVHVANPAITTSWSAQGKKVPFTEGNVADLAVAPNGGALYVGAVGFLDEERVGMALDLPLALSATEQPAWAMATFNPTTATGVLPTAVTVSPNGQTVFVGGTMGNSANSAVQARAAGNGALGASALVPIKTNDDGTFGLNSLAVTPDGRSLLTTGADDTAAPIAEVVYPLSLPNLGLGPRSRLSNLRSFRGPQEIAITPDLAPAAHLGPVVSVHVGQNASFDASSSTVTYGSISNFSWDFGDGTTKPVAGPIVSHAFATLGPHVVTVTETDSAGTTVPPAVPGTGFGVDGPGQTPYRLASLAARTSVSVSVTATITTSPTNPTTTPTTPPTAPSTATTPTTTPGQPSVRVPTLVLNPAVGPPGTIVTVTGTGFRPNSPVTVAWSTSTGSVVIIADAQGRLPPSQLLILTPDVLGPRFAQASSTPQAVAPFLVVPSDSEPGGDNAGLLFRSEGP
jgi:PKD domain